MTVDRSDGWLRSQVQPRDVPAYAEAVASGHVRPVPNDPPVLAIRPSAGSRARHIVVAGTLALVAALILVKVSQPALPQGWPALLLTLIGCIIVAATLMAWARLGRTCIREFSHGYTTFEITFGTYWLGTGRYRPGNANRPPWDFSALWLLESSSGTVLRSPTKQSDPPGMYPSPHRDGVLELWSGLVWMDYFADYPATR